MIEISKILADLKGVLFNDVSNSLIHAVHGRSEFFQCPWGFQIPMFLRCDGNNNCGDNADEENCEQDLTQGKRKFVASTIKKNNHRCSVIPRYSSKLEQGRSR